MSIETELFTKLTTALAAQVSTRVYPLTAPEGAALPLITYECAQRNTFHTLDGVGNTALTRIRIGVHALSYATAKSIATAMKTALSGWTYPLSKFFEDEEDLIDDEVVPHVYIVSHEWSFHHTT